MESLNVVGTMAVKGGETPKSKSAGRQPGGPYPANFQKVHDRLIVIDASCPLLSLPKPPQIKHNLFDL